MSKSIALAAAILFAVPGLAQADYRSALESYDNHDYQSAFREFEISANAGDAASQFMVAEMYARGTGVAQNYVKAHMWYNLASSWGHDRAGQARSQLETYMTSGQIAEAQAMAEKWQPGSAATNTGNKPAFSVRNAQMLLNGLGYIAGPEDGIMGSKTRSAIRGFQQDRGIGADGQLTYALFDRIAADAGKRVSSSASTSDRTQLISNVQAELRRRGYDVPQVTGQLDSRTAQAIRIYQSDSGLTVNGEANESLLARLRSSQGTDKQTQANLIVAVQTRLNDLGYNAGPEDGVFGPTTRSAVRTFQNDNKLPVTGEISQNLLDKIQIASGEDNGDTDREVALAMSVEKALDARGYQVGTVDGKVTSQTTTAVRTYQSDAGIAVDGRIDGKLLQYLERGQSADADMTRTELVQSIQASLNDRGYKAGPADGVFGPSTRRAILFYQTDAELPLTGEASRQLLQHIASSNVKPGTLGLSDAEVSAQLNRDIQVELIRLGFRVGEQDGGFDELTRKAVMSYQHQANIEQTGVPTPQLLARLQNSYRSSIDPNSVIQGLANQFINEIFTAR